MMRWQQLFGNFVQLLPLSSYNCIQVLLCRKIVFDNFMIKNKGQRNMSVLIIL